MEETGNSTLNLDSIQTISQLSNGKSKMLMESCVWCLYSCKHANGVKLDLAYDDKNYLYGIKWPDDQIDIETINKSYNQNDATESGAEAIAILVSLDLTDYTSIYRSITHTGIDYWLGYENKNPNHPFERASRLEISGILKETPNNKIDKRVKNKLIQAKQSARTQLPVFVVVVEFGKPQAYMVAQ